MGCSSSRPVHPDGEEPPPHHDLDPSPPAGPSAAGEGPNKEAGRSVSVAQVRALVRGAKGATPSATGYVSMRDVVGGGGGGAASASTPSTASRWGFSSSRTLKSTGSFVQVTDPGGGNGPGATTTNYAFYTIRDKYETLEEVSEGLRAAGLESSNLVLAVDFTKSNTWTGKNTFGGRSLHYLDPSGRVLNPYMTVISCIGKALSGYDDDNLIPVFGFGDSTTTDRSVFPFFPDRPARGFEEVLARYRELVPRVIMSGPTNFAPAIEAAIQIVQATRAYHILLIIADGQVTNRAHTEAAIVRASEYPLSIVLVGVGDGPWDMMETFDDSLPSRRFDNFQFLKMQSILDAHPNNPEVAFAIGALMEVPEQYSAIRRLGYL